MIWKPKGGISVDDVFIAFLLCVGSFGLCVVVGLTIRFIMDYFGIR